MEKFLIREGRLSDCADIARLINQSAQGAGDYLFGQEKLKPGGAEKIMSDLLSREVHYSFANTIVMDLANKVIGIALSFPSSGLMINENVKQYYSEQQFQYIQYFVDNKLTDSWHLDAICVNSDCRGMGIGQRLLDSVKQQAAYYNFPTLEVFVFATNVRAIKFYKRNQFVISREIDVANHEFLTDKGPLVLMRFDFERN
ncbi:MAG: GNAT family N-acetyltransferase [Gammaproteobacteria bacterium]|nr:GNAT family N-acetyltransferase [Gammaproteobacteria bacterium]